MNSNMTKAVWAGGGAPGEVQMFARRGDDTHVYTGNQ